MAAVGGSILEVTLDGNIFAVAADSEAQRKRGGFENEVAANGGGSARIIKTRVPLSLSGLTLEVDGSIGQDEILQDLSNRLDYFPISYTEASGITYVGRAIITGELQVSSQSATASVDLMGPGEITKSFA